MIADFDFFALVETRHKENNSHDFSVNGYNLQCFYRASLSRRAKRGSGGIAVYIKEQLTGGIEKIKDTNLTIVEDRVWFRMCKEFLGWRMIYTLEYGTSHHLGPVDIHNIKACGKT